MKVIHGEELMCTNPLVVKGGINSCTRSRSTQFSFNVVYDSSVNLTLFILSVSGHRSSCLSSSYLKLVVWSIEGQGKIWGPRCKLALSQELADRLAITEDMSVSQYEHTLTDCVRTILK